MHTSVIVLSLGLLVVGSETFAAAPLVPPGWREVGNAGPGARTFVSRNGSARLRIGHTAAHSENLRADIDRITFREAERITYEQHGRTWVAVSGYRDDGTIFYRKGNLACGGTRWHLVEFRYPREAKRQMDAAVTDVAHRMGAFRNDCR